MTQMHALECQMQFLGEQRSKPYSKYGARVAQQKITYGTESTLQMLALPDLGRCGAGI